MDYSRTFWECVYDARVDGSIARAWRTEELIDFLARPAGRFSPNTVNVDPYNYSISRVGSGIGYFVKRGEDPKAWRVEPGVFQLVADPDDDANEQSREREMARKRAEELIAQIRGGGGRRADRGVQPSSQAETITNATTGRSRYVKTPDQYESVPITLNHQDRQLMNGLRTEQKALYIVEKHIRDEYGEQVVTEEDRDGADLRISVGGRTVKRIEVKGTASKDIAWSQLKVSSQKSHDALESGEAAMYRVVDVDSAHPRIYILTYGQDFTMEPEPRWAVKQTRMEDDRYPLRGRPYRYLKPHEPVAQDDWETLE